MISLPIRGALRVTENLLVHKYKLLYSRYYHVKQAYCVKCASGM